MSAPAWTRAGVSAGRKRADWLFRAACLMAVLVACAFLAFLLVAVMRDGAGRIDLKFLSEFSSRLPQNAGIKAAVFGTLWVIGLTALVSIPVGIAAAIYLEEFGHERNKLAQFVQLNIQNLAGVPSIVFGLLGLAVFVRFFDLGRSVIAGALTMSLLILPTIIVVAQEAIRAVPSSYRDGALALGATKWQAIRGQVLPAALPGVITGVILAVSRAIGESAPLITIGAVAFIGRVPDGPMSKFTVLPIQIYDWSSRPQKGFHENAAGAIIVLMAVLLVLNGAAIWIRARTQKRV